MRDTGTYAYIVTNDSTANSSLTIKLATCSVHI